jgi:hypothetical protein
MQVKATVDPDLAQCTGGIQRDGDRSEVDTDCPLPTEVVSGYVSDSRIVTLIMFVSPGPACTRWGARQSETATDTAQSVAQADTATRTVCNIFPPFGMCLVIGIQRAGRRRSPAATGSGRGRMDRIGLGRPSHPPDFQGGPDAREHGSCHVRHHPLMGTADVNRRGSVRSLVCDHSFF